MAGWSEVKEGAERDTGDAPMSASAAMQRWGGLASFLMAVAYIIPSWIYLVGDLRDALGPLAYALADFMYGPVWAACLVATVLALRERIGERAPRRMSLALLAALVAAGAIVGVACIRSANRQYLLMHPELSDAASSTLLMTWATIVTGVIATCWHFLGWALLLVGSAGWTSRHIPRGLSVLYVVALPFAGVHIVEATKQVYRAIPAGRERTRLIPSLEPVLVPSSTATRGKLGES